MAKQPKNQLTATNFGPIRRADVAFGDLNISVGSQATGKEPLFPTLQQNLLVISDSGGGPIGNQLAHSIP